MLHVQLVCTDRLSSCCNAIQYSLMNAYTYVTSSEKKLSLCTESVFKQEDSQLVLESTECLLHVKQEHEPAVVVVQFFDCVNKVVYILYSLGATVMTATTHTSQPQHMTTVES